MGKQSISALYGVTVGNRGRGVYVSVLCVQGKVQFFLSVLP